MVELVDTPDLKSCGPQARAGSTPAPGTRVEKPEQLSVQAFFMHFWYKKAAFVKAALVMHLWITGRYWVPDG